MVELEERIVDVKFVPLEPLEEVGDDGEAVDHGGRHPGVLSPPGPG